MASLFDAIVLQNLAVLSRGHTLRPRVLLLGGPNAFIRGLREAWQAHILRVWRERGVLPPGGAGEPGAVEAPPFAAHLVALGAIEFGRRDGRPSRSTAAHEALAEPSGRRAARPAGAAAPALAVVGHVHGGVPARGTTCRRGSRPASSRATDVDGFIGLDAGSTSTKAVLLDEAGAVVAKAYQLSRGNPIEDAIDMFRALRAQVESQGASIDVRGLGTTGYAKDMLQEVLAADVALVETVAHTQSALQFYDDPHVIVDVGRAGHQDHRAARRAREGLPPEHAVLGGQRLLPAGDAQSFGVPVEQFAEAAFSAREMPQFGYGCVLFLQSDIVDFQRHGWRPARCWPAWRTCCRRTSSCTWRRRRTCRASARGSSCRAGRSATSPR